MDETTATDDLCIGASSPKKVVHHRRCQHARLDYLWARGFPTLRALAEALVETGGWRWHSFCRVCCGDLADEVQAALAVTAE